MISTPIVSFIISSHWFIYSVKDLNAIQIDIIAVCDGEIETFDNGIYINIQNWSDRSYKNCFTTISYPQKHSAKGNNNNKRKLTFQLLAVVRFSQKIIDLEPTQCTPHTYKVIPCHFVRKILRRRTANKKESEKKTQKSKHLQNRRSISRNWKHCELRFIFVFGKSVWRERKAQNWKIEKWNETSIRDICRAFGNDLNLRRIRLTALIQKQNLSVETFKRRHWIPFLNSY